MLVADLGYLRGRALRRPVTAGPRRVKPPGSRSSRPRSGWPRNAAPRPAAKTARLLEEELLRAQEAMRELAEQAAAAAVAERGKRVATISYRPVAGVRGRAYEVGPAA